VGGKRTVEWRGHGRVKRAGEKAGDEIERGGDGWRGE